MARCRRTPIGARPRLGIRCASRRVASRRVSRRLDDRTLFVVARFAASTYTDDARARAGRCSPMMKTIGVTRHARMPLDVAHLHNTNPSTVRPRRDRRGSRVDLRRTRHGVDLNALRQTSASIGRRYGNLCRNGRRMSERRMSEHPPYDDDVDNERGRARAGAAPIDARG